MIYTSYYAMCSAMPQNMMRVGISRYVPQWFRGYHCLALAPTQDILDEWRAKHDRELYTQRFNKEVLATATQAQCLSFLSSKAECPRIWEDPHNHIVLLCYEKPSDFCHRHLVTEWLRKVGVKCKEWEKGDAIWFRHS